jgi:hypothetical protein
MGVPSDTVVFPTTVADMQTTVAADITEVQHAVVLADMVVDMAVAADKI